MSRSEIPTPKTEGGIQTNGKVDRVPQASRWRVTTRVSTLACTGLFYTAIVSPAVIAGARVDHPCSQVLPLNKFSYYSSSLISYPHCTSYTFRHHVALAASKRTRENAFCFLSPPEDRISQASMDVISSVSSSASPSISRISNASPEASRTQATRRPSLPLTANVTFPALHPVNLLDCTIGTATEAI